MVNYGNSFVYEVMGVLKIVLFLEWGFGWRLFVRVVVFICGKCGIWLIIEEGDRWGSYWWWLWEMCIINIWLLIYYCLCCCWFKIIEENK